ncbi:MAG: DUF3108 domain-containing protein [Lautropia sp.]
MLPLLAVLPAAVLGGGARRGAAQTRPVTLTGLPALPAAATLRYQVFYGDASRDLAVAEIDYRLTHGDGRYRCATEGRAVGVVALFYSGTLTQTSTGTVGDGGLRPERYTEQRGKRAERSIRFDHARGVMIGRGDPSEIALPPGTQDRLSIFFQLGLIARARPAQFVKGHRFTIPLATMRDIDQPTFLVAGSESQKTGRGPLDTVRVTVRNESDPKDPVFDVWLAPSLTMLPARIRMQEDDGKVVDQVLQATVP